MNYILFDGEARTHLLPFTYTRPVGEIRIGILKIREKWELFLRETVSCLTEEYLSRKFPLIAGETNILINGSVLPTAALAAEIMEMKPGTRLMSGETVVAVHAGNEKITNQTNPLKLKSAAVNSAQKDVLVVRHNWDIFNLNAQALTEDFRQLTAGKKSSGEVRSSQLIFPENIFIEEGAVVTCAVLNASGGPIYIGKDAEVMEGAVIRGPFALGEHAQVRMGAKIYGATTIGPHSKVGGEISNSVIMGFSNKAHDGFLGNSVLGEWCNLGADTNNSNLKNNYSKVKVWDYHANDYINTGLQFCGLIMGDHSKSGINTMFNTGTVAGVSANIFGSGFPPKFIPSFAWGGAEGFATYRLEDAAEVAQRVYERRSMEFDADDMAIMKHLFEITSRHRAW